MLQEQEIRRLKKPIPDKIIIRHVIETFFTDYQLVEEKVKTLDSYDDGNIYLELVDISSRSNIFTKLEQNDSESKPTQKFLMKFFNSFEDDTNGLITGISLLLKEIIANQPLTFNVPIPVQTSHTKEMDVCFIENVPLVDGTTSRIAVRLFDWVHGVTLDQCQISFDLLHQVGMILGAMKKSLESFDHPSFHRFHVWDLVNFQSSLFLIQYLDDPELIEAIGQIHEVFQNEVLPRSHQFHQSIIMGDANDANIIVSPHQNKVVGLIDFSDAVYTWSINELAIAMAYSLLTPFGMANPVKTLIILLIGYNRFYQADDVELEYMLILLAVRLCISTLNGAYAIHKDPVNEYLKKHAIPARKAIKDVYKWWVTSRQAWVLLFKDIQQHHMLLVDSNYEHLNESELDRIIQRYNI